MPNTIINKADISKKLENESGVKVVLKPTKEMDDDDDEKDISIRKYADYEECVC
jgi:hypothetical protein